LLESYNVRFDVLAAQIGFKVEFNASSHERVTRQKLLYLKALQPLTNDMMRIIRSSQVT